MNRNEAHMHGDRGSIVDQILNDTIEIQSVTEFEALLDIFPDDPDLYRKFADRLADGKLPEAALVAYNKAAALYLDAGMVLQSIVAKILEWSIVKPSHREGRAFHSEIRRKGSGDHPSQLLFSQLTYEEMVSLMRRLIRERLPAGETVYETGQEATHIYFIVAGELKEDPSSATTVGSVCGTSLAQNDIFGDIFPLEEASFCQARVTTTTAVELVKIAKPVLKAICYRFPRIRELLERLSRVRSVKGRERSWKTVRRSCRYCLPAAVQLGFTNGGGSTVKVLEGTSRDLSIGGICIALKNNTTHHDTASLLDRQAALSILENGQTLIDGLVGKVAWLKTVGSKSHPTQLIGLAFEPMPEETEMALNAFCTISDGEQDMIWNLWNHLVRH